MVSEHASPLAVLGGVDAGGQNVHVAALADGARPAWATRSSCTRAATTRRCRAACRSRPAWRSTTSTPGRRASCRRTSCCRTWATSPHELREQWADEPPDVVHAHFWMSALAALAAARDARHPGRAHVPRARRRQAPPPGRAGHEPAATGSRSSAAIARRVDRVVATCTDEVFELVRHGRRPAADHRRAVRRRPRALHARRPRPSRARPAAHRLVVACRLVERKGIADAVAALAGVPDAELLVAGGPDASALDADPEARRLRALAAAARRRRPARAARPRRARRRCRRCCARPTSWSACPGTSRSGSCRSRRWPAASPSWRPRSAGRSTPSSTASPACTCRRATRRRSPARCASCSRTPSGARGSGPRACGARASASRYDRVAAATREVYAEVVLRRVAAGARRAETGRRGMSRPLPAGRRHLAALDGAAAARCAPRRPGSSAGAASSPTVLVRRRAAARRGQRRLRRPGPAPDRRARRPLPRRPPAVQRDRAERRDLGASPRSATTTASRRSSPARCAPTAARATCWSRSRPPARSPNVLAAVDAAAEHGHAHAGR